MKASSSPRPSPHSHSANEEREKKSRRSRKRKRVIKLVPNARDQFMVTWLDGHNQQRFNFYDAQPLAEQAAFVTKGTLWKRQK
jgi:hypothetical protein